jgi:hypothetical protein
VPRGREGRNDDTAAFRQVEGGERIANGDSRTPKGGGPVDGEGLADDLRKLLIHLAGPDPLGHHAGQHRVHLAASYC